MNLELECRWMRFRMMRRRPGQDGGKGMISQLKVSGLTSTRFSGRQPIILQLLVPSMHARCTKACYLFARDFVLQKPRGLETDHGGEGESSI